MERGGVGPGSANRVCRLAVVACIGACLASVVLVHWATPASAQGTSAQRQKFQPYADLGFKPGNRRGIGQLNLMIPLLQQGDWILFADLRGVADTERGLEGNAGLGYRGMIGTKYRWIYGGYAFFDARRTKSNKLYYQINPGVELLSEDFDVRANGYIPVGRTRHQLSGSTTSAGGAGQVQVVGTRIFMSVPGGGEEEVSMAGVDAEAGVRIPWLGEPEVRLYAGGYAFFRPGVKPIIGPRFRAEARLFDLPLLGPQSRFTFGIETSWDRVRKQQVYGFLNLRIPLGAVAGSPAPVLDSFERRMVDPVVKDVDIVTEKRKTGGPGGEEPVKLRGVEIKEVQPVNAGDDLPAKVAAAPEGTIFVIIGNVATAVPANVLSNQFFIGGGTTLAFTGARTGAAGSFTFAGAPGVLTTSTGAFSLTGAVNVLFKNFAVNDTGTFTFLLNAGTDRVSLEDMVVNHTSPGGAAATLYNPFVSGSIEIIRSQIVTSNAASIMLANITGLPAPPVSSGALLIDGSTITSDAGSAINFNARNSYDVTIRNNSVLGTTANTTAVQMVAQLGAVVNFLMTDSRVTSPTWVGMSVDTPSPAQFFVTIRDSRIDSGRAAFAASPNNGGTVVATFSDNVFNTTSFGNTVHFNVNSSVSFASSACLNATGNTLTHPGGSSAFAFFNLNGGVMNVVDLPNLSANNGGAVVNPGPATSVAACP